MLRADSRKYDEWLSALDRYSQVQKGTRCSPRPFCWARTLPQVLAKTTLNWRVCATGCNSGDYRTWRSRCLVEMYYPVAACAEILLAEVYSGGSREGYVIGDVGPGSDPRNRVQIIVPIAGLSKASQITIQKAGVGASSCTSASTSRWSKLCEVISKKAGSAKVSRGKSVFCADDGTYVGSSRSLVGSLPGLHQVGNSDRSDDQDDGHHDQQ